LLRKSKVFDSISSCQLLRKSKVFDSISSCQLLRKSKVFDSINRPSSQVDECLTRMLARALALARRPVGRRCLLGSRLGSERGVATLIDGKAISEGILDDVRTQVDILKDQYGDEVGTPSLAVVLVGDRPDSGKYVQMKKKAAKKIGFNSIEETLPEDCTHDQLLSLVRKLNDREDIDGVLVQLPLPPQCNQKEILEAINVEKDVDGFHPFNMGRLTRQGEDLRMTKQEFIPLESRNASCTPLGAIVLLEKAGVDLNGKNAVVLGRSNIVGLPVALMLLHRNATVRICHSRTHDLPAACREADILIAAIGKAEFVKGSWIKPGAAVIDVGINFKKDPTRKSGYRMCGDVDFDEAKEVAGAITPVPGKSVALSV